jgi:hypothetical protein
MMTRISASWVPPLHTLTSSFMNLADYWKEIIATVVTLLAAGFAIRFSIRKRKSVSNINRSNQTKNTVGGDQAGRDINKG